jgi:hypothetical protein
LVSFGVKALDLFPTLETVIADFCIARLPCGLCLAKASYTHKMNDLAQSSIQAFPIRFLP